MQALSEAKDVKPLAPDFAEKLCTRAFVEKQATQGLSHRAGLGKARHIEMANVWIQDALDRREFELVKISGGYKPADVLTKPVSQNTLHRHLAALGDKVLPAARVHSPLPGSVCVCVCV